MSNVNSKAIANENNDIEILWDVFEIICIFLLKKI